MSSNTTDLIDFHVGPTVLPATSETDTTFDSDNLIDTELPIFEQKLLTQSTNLTSTSSRRESIDVEDILIKIDSDGEYERDSLDGEEVECEDFLDVCDAGDETSVPVDNFEALLVLKNLDDLLNATLAQSDDIVNGNVPGQSDDDTHVIEECLEELDNYLEAIDTDSDSNSSESYTEHSLEEPQQEFDEELARVKLRQIEENYRKFVASGIVNRGYIDTENNGNFTLDGHLRRPSSACAIPKQLFNRKRPLRSNSVNGTRGERPRLIRRISLVENYTIPQVSTLNRTSGTDGLGAIPSDYGRLSHNVDRERHAHGSNDCCTGTVIVEPIRRQSNTSSSSSVGHMVPLRSSMRRLEQVTLPSVNLENGSAVSRVEIGEDGRPVSAPSRLPPLATIGDRSRSRSRNADQHHSSRTRSSSESSRSRRGRSASSGTSATVSSVDHTEVRMPNLEGNHSGGNQQDNPTNNSQRGCWWLNGLLSLFTVCRPGRSRSETDFP